MNRNDTMHGGIISTKSNGSATCTGTKNLISITEEKAEVKCQSPHDDLPEGIIDPKTSSSTAELLTEDVLHERWVEQAPPAPRIPKSELRRDASSESRKIDLPQGADALKDKKEADREISARLSKLSPTSATSDSDKSLRSGEEKENEPKIIKSSAGHTSYGNDEDDSAAGKNRESIKKLPVFGRYKDHSQMTFAYLSNSERSNLHLYNTNTIGGPFPIKLQIVLKVIQQMGKENVISWLVHGRAFIINRPREFENDIMGRFFKQTKLSSFKRQLNLYDFQRITQGPDAGSYYHEMFLRGKPILAMKMTRRKIKGNDRITHGNVEDEPNFYSMPSLNPVSIQARKDLALQQGFMHHHNGMQLPGSNFHEYNNNSFARPKPPQSHPNLSVVDIRRHGALVNQAHQERKAHHNHLMSSMMPNQNHHFPDPRAHLFADSMSRFQQMGGMRQYNLPPANEGPYGNLNLGAQSSSGIPSNLPNSSNGIPGMVSSSVAASSDEATSTLSSLSSAQHQRHFSSVQNNMLTQQQRHLLLENQLFVENMRGNSIMNNLPHANHNALHQTSYFNSSSGHDGGNVYDRGQDGTQGPPSNGMALR